MGGDRNAHRQALGLFFVDLEVLAQLRHHVEVEHSVDATAERFGLDELRDGELLEAQLLLVELERLSQAAKFLDHSGKDVDAACVAACLLHVLLFEPPDEIAVLHGAGQSLFVGGCKQADLPDLPQVHADGIVDAFFQLEVGRGLSLGLAAGPDVYVESAAGGGNARSGHIVVVGQVAATWLDHPVAVIVVFVVSVAVFDGVVH